MLDMSIEFFPQGTRESFYMVFKASLKVKPSQDIYQGISMLLNYARENIFYPLFSSHEPASTQHKLSNALIVSGKPNWFCQRAQHKSRLQHYFPIIF